MKIGIYCYENEKEIVREFFEFFKTPWEFYVEEQNYDVVVTTVDKTTIELNGRLVIIYSSKPTSFDGQINNYVSTAVSEFIIDHNGTRLPIYGELAKFRGHGTPLMYDQSNSDPVVLEIFKPPKKILRVGYDLFCEVDFLLSEGQPAENALIPTLEHHIVMLRNWIIDAGIPVIEIPPIPWGYRFITCLTHDVDFVGICKHKLDHTFWGFIYRALVESILAFIKGRSSLTRLLINWKAVFSLPFVYLGLVRDFRDQFEQYSVIDKHFSSTFFMIPFKNRAGSLGEGEFPYRRAARYDILDVLEKMEMLTKRGYEIGLHGIDAWLSVERGEQELKQIVKATGQDEVGVRIHWLKLDDRSPFTLDQAGFSYDSTFGYNETVGYRVGTTQVFRPLGVKHLLELPLHIQDTAIFLPHRLALTEVQAWDLCTMMMTQLDRYGGVLTVLWHMRSLAPERLWGDFYERLLQELRDRGAWFGNAGQVVRWFRRRRSVRFEDYRFVGNMLLLHLKCEDVKIEAPLILRVHRPRKDGFVESNDEQLFVDIPWNGDSLVEIPLA